MELHIKARDQLQVFNTGLGAPYGPVIFYILPASMHGRS